MFRFRLNVRSTNLNCRSAAVEQPLHRGEERVERHVPHRHVERRQAELALERAAARRLDVDDAVGESSSV